MSNEKKKLILIDGNSLLNRAFYAMSVFTTKDGMPTNGIFGFVKLMFKIIEDKSPAYFVVAFDVHAPTFRHKLYDGYKATRKPMPDALVAQVPVLKELLNAMRIRTVELEGYEADDLIGTLSRKFEGVETFIYTGDRDAYQLVREGVNICFTRRGVSDVDLITAENFKKKVGLEPWQIIEEKSLMGDSSDNIPGVKGIGPKSALDLLRDYGSLEGVYQNLGKLSPALAKKLEAERETARLSHTLAAIDTNVPLDIRLEDCKLTVPFPEEARAFFVRLEFRSLVDGAYFAGKSAPANTVSRSVVCTDLEEALKAADGITEFSVAFVGKEFHLFFGDTEFLFPIKETIFDTGFFYGDLKPLFAALFAEGKHAYVTDVKAVLHKLADLGIEPACTIDDVSLMRYLADSNQRALGTDDFIKDFGLPQENSARSIRLVYEDAARSLHGTAEEKLYRELELPLARVLFGMEQLGVRVDLEKFPFFSEKFNAELSELSEKIFGLAGVDPFNLNSPFQLSEVLFEKLGYSPQGVKRNIRGGYSTSAEVLEKLAEEHEIARLILRYREIQKLQSTYIDGIRPLAVGGIVHTTYNQMMTTTGRLSSANPNLQNIPVRTEVGRELRKLFIAREGNVFVDADYSQIELRLLAHFSGCKALVKAYNEGEDIHSATAARIFGVEREGVTSAMRRRAKTINFGIIYGMSAFGLSKDLGCSTSEAQEYISKYFAAHPEVKDYMDANVKTAKEQGYVTTILGRKRYIPELKSPNYNIRSFGERAAMNMPLQGSAADIIKIAMLNVADRLQRDGFAAKMVLQVHDELVLDTPLEEEERAKAALKEEMERAVTLSVPLIAEVSAGKSWYDAK